MIIHITFLLLLSFIPLFDLFHPGLPLTHDGQDHVVRIANFYQNLKEGNIVPRWAANLNWGYGHPILMFLYPLPSYIASLFHFLGFSVIDSVKIVFGLTFVLSGALMFLWIKEFLGEKPAFLGALLYMFAPYRFVDLYVRGAIGEHVAFIFPPLIFYFLLKLSKTTQNLNHSEIAPPRSPSPLRQGFAGRVGHLGGVLKGLPRGGFWYVAGGSFSIACLILSHNAISLMFLPFIFLYALYLFWIGKKKKRLIYQYTSIFVFGLGLSAFFWFPAFFEGKYTLRDIVTTGGYAANFVHFQNFIFSPWSYGGSGEFSVQIGIVGWIVVILAIPVSIVLRKKKDRLWILTTSTFLIFATTLFLMTSYSQFVWKTVTTLQKFQFPWRFLSISVFTTAVLGGLTVYAIPKRIQLGFLGLALIVILIINKDYWHAKDYLIKPENFYTNVYEGTTDTGESSPIWSVRFMENMPKAPIEFITGEGSIREIKRLSTYHEYQIEAKKQSRIRENTLYFPGWEVFLDGKIVLIEFQDPANRGLMTFFVEKGNYTIEVKFKETKLRLFANYISLASAAGLLAFVWIRKKLLV